MTATSHRKLTVFVKKVLDLLLGLALVALVVWPLAVIAMASGQISAPTTWGVDIGVYSHLSIDLSALNSDLTASSGVREPVLHGNAELNIDTTSLKALLAFTGLTMIAGVVGVYVLLQLRAVFALLVAGESFASSHATRLRNVGLAVVFWSVLQPFLQYGASSLILSEYALSVPGIQLSPAAQTSGMALFIGIATLILSGVLREAAELHEEQQLTV